MTKQAIPTPFDLDVEPARVRADVAAVVLDARHGVVLSAPHTARVVILGKGPSSQQVRPQPGVEQWEMNVGPMVRSVPGGSARRPWTSVKDAHGRALGRVQADVTQGTRFFQIHLRSILSQSEELWLRLCPVPIYTMRWERALPASVRYPLERILDTFGTDVPLSSSFDYAFALALAERFTHITTAGVDLQRGTWRERLVEHVSHAYWLGRARGMGVTVVNKSWSVRAPLRYGGRDYWGEALWGRREVANALLSNANIHDWGASPKAIRRLSKLW